MPKITIDAWAKRTGARVDEAARAIKIELFNSVILDTRVLTGRLAGNWQTSTGEPIKSMIDRLDPNHTLAMGDVVATVTADGVDYLTNNLSYAAIWNERDGMIDKNLARLNQIIRKATR